MKNLPLILLVLGGIGVGAYLLLKPKTQAITVQYPQSTLPYIPSGGYNYASSNMQPWGAYAGTSGGVPISSGSSNVTIWAEPAPYTGDDFAGSNVSWQ